MNNDTVAPPLFEGLPGSELVTQGLADLSQNTNSKFALLLRVAGPRLRALDINIPVSKGPKSFEHLLYEALEEEYGPAAYTQYNALIRRISSFTRALSNDRRASRHSN
jgi:hypothetical protein